MAIDREVVYKRVRFLLSDPSEDLLSEETLYLIIDDKIATIGSEDEFYCEVVQASLLEALRYLMRQDEQPTSIAGGELTKRREKRGQSEIEETYSTETESSDSGWERIYDDYINNPHWICESLKITENPFLLSIGSTGNVYHRPRVNRKFRSARHKRYHERRYPRR